MKWTFSCGCQKHVHVEVDDQDTVDKTRQLAHELLRSRYNWVGIPDSDLLSCSPTCWNSYHEAIYTGRKKLYPWWWEESPHGRRKHECEMPTCDCPPHFVTVFMRDDLGIRGRKVELLDGWHHDDSCWWKERA